MGTPPILENGRVERRIDFLRERRMLCGICDHQWTVDLDWIERWNQGQEICPSCGMNCEDERSAQVTIDPGDAALEDQQVAAFAWYHTSTQPDWPTALYDPASELTARVRRMMGGQRRVDEWAARKRGAALHVGTYEAAIHNMLRRITDQADIGKQFYLYRVHLRPSVVVKADWCVDPSNFVGDVALAEICPPGVDVARYLNHHEDPGGISLALGRGAIASVQRVAVPLADVDDRIWIRHAVSTLVAESSTVNSTTDNFGRIMGQPSPQAILGLEIVNQLASRLPVNLREQFSFAASFADEDTPEQWAIRAAGLFDLINDPSRVLARLGQQEHREI